MKFNLVILVLIALMLCSSGANGQAAPGAAGSSDHMFSSKYRVYDVLPVAQRSDEISLDGTWELARATREFGSTSFDVSGLKWTQVEMPATIQYALFKANAIEDPWYGENWKKLRWIQNSDWFLRRQFHIPDAWKGRHIRLRFDGIDYTGAVWLDGKFLGIHEGMFGGPTFDISSAAVSGPDHELLIRLIHEKDGPEPQLWNINAPYAMKPAALDGSTYIWATRFRTIGLWRSVRLVSSGQAYMEAPWVRTDEITAHSASLSAEVTLVNSGTSFQGIIHARIVGPNGIVAWQHSTIQSVPSGTSSWDNAIEIRNPHLWWSNGMGAQPLYRLELSLTTGAKQQDAISTRFGIRTIELRRNPYPPEQPHSNPELPSWLSSLSMLSGRHGANLWKRFDTEWPWPSDNLLEDDALYNSDEGARYLFVVNGRPVYVKGICWLTSNDLLAFSPQRESWLIHAAKAAGINLFLLNGGSDLFETEEFYNLCDELGILVWQEFPITWARRIDVPLTTWREQIKQSVLRLRQHPSLALYVGGNEFNPYLEALAPYMGVGREIIAEYDDRPFRMSSPDQSDYHAYNTPTGSFANMWIGDPNWYSRYFGENANFIGEWSLSAFTNLSALKRVIPPQELTESPVGYDINQFDATHPNIEDHFPQAQQVIPLIQRKLSWYGDLGKADLADYIEYSQMAQADVYGYVFEQWRAQFPYKGGETVWTYNPPSASSGWQVIDWFGQPQISYYAIKRADEPIHVMANTHFFTWGPGSTFQASVFALNDGTIPIAGTHVTARLLDSQMQDVFTRRWILSIPANGIKSATRELSWHIPSATADGYFFLELTLSGADGHQLSRRIYWLRVLKSLASPAALAKWQSTAVAEPLTQNGPWLKPQIAEFPTDISAHMLSSRVAGPNLQVVLSLKNTGRNPAYPVRLSVQPDTYSVLWSDDYFWLAPGESVMIKGTVRLDMRALDPISNPPVASPSNLHFSVSAWNAPPENF